MVLLLSNSWLLLYFNANFVTDVNKYCKSIELLMFAQNFYSYTQVLGPKLSISSMPVALINISHFSFNVS